MGYLRELEPSLFVVLPKVEQEIVFLELVREFYELLDLGWSLVLSLRSLI